MIVRTKFTLAVVALATLSGCSSMRPIPVIKVDTADITDIQTAIGAMKTLSEKYQEKSDELAKDNYLASDITFGGGVVAAVGGLIKSTATAVTGVAAAGGGSFAAERYVYETQSLNYERAADAMDCMLAVLIPNKSVTGVDATFLNLQVDKVKKSLRKAQRDTKLQMPDIGKLKEAIGQARQAEQNLKVAGIANPEARAIESKIAECAAAF